MKPTKKELERLEKFIKVNPWRFAKTYANTAPHEYVVLGHLSEAMRKEFRWFESCITKFGTKMPYYRTFFIYLYIGKYKYWIDGGYNGETILNRADHDGGLKNPYDKTYQKKVESKVVSKEEIKTDREWFKKRTQVKQQSLL